jgi:hypothetical protein
MSRGMHCRAPQGNVKPVVVLIAALLVGCGQQSGSESARLDSLARALARVEQTIAVNEILESIRDVAFLRPGADGYSAIETEIGVVTISLENVEPYANGTRVTVQFGNTTGATINGLEATIEWGMVDSAGSPVNATGKSKQVTVTQALRAGSWTQEKFVLESILPQDFGFLRFRDVTHAGIRLNRY